MKDKIEQKNYNIFSNKPFLPCCGSGRFFTEFGSDFWKRPYPDKDYDLNKFSAKYFLEIILAEICSKKYIHEKKLSSWDS
jgi:hypothetical protein